MTILFRKLCFRVFKTETGQKSLDDTLAQSGSLARCDTYAWIDFLAQINTLARSDILELILFCSFFLCLNDIRDFIVRKSKNELCNIVTKS